MNVGRDGSVTVVRRPRLRSAPVAVFVAVVAAEVAVLLLLPRSGVLEPAHVDAASEFTARQIDRARDFRTTQLALYGGTLVVEAGLLALLVVRPPRSLLRRRGHPVAVSALAGAAISAALVVATLPIAAVMRQRSIDVGLTTRSWGGWAWDVALSTLISATFAAAATAAGIGLMRRMPRRWWLPASGLVVAAGAAFVFAGPLVIEPVFNRFDELPAGRTRTDVLDLAQKAGIKVGDVYVVDASKRTTSANAYVTGLGSSKRVVLYDTLLRDFDPKETRLVVAHELGHVRYHDVPRGLLYLLLVAPAAMFAVAALVRAWGPRPREIAGPQTVPALLAATALVAALVGTVSNQLSRRVESRADSFALGLTGDPATFIAQQRTLALQNVSDPDPPGVVRWLLGTHPTTVQRIGMGRAYEEGERP